MKLTGKNILLISPESWGNHKVSKHHYALELAKKGNKVFFLNRPSADFKSEVINENLRIVNYKPLFRGYSRMPGWLAALFIRKDIKNIEKHTGVTFDILWNFDPSRFFNFSAVSGKTRIAHLVDLNQVFERKTLVGTADIAFCTSKVIREKIVPFNEQTFIINHGLQHTDKSSVKSELIKAGPAVKVGYIGNLTYRYIDWRLIEKLVMQSANEQFYFIGPLGKSNLANDSGLQTNRPSEALLQAENAFFPGPVDSHEIPATLKNFDILILVYKIADKEQMSNPHKVMEYLSTGKVIISTALLEYEHLDELIITAQTEQGFLDNFRKVTDELAYYNSDELSDRRKQYAAENTYEKQIEKIENHLSNCL